MATMNPFGLLGDDDTEDLSQLIAARQVAAPKKATAQPTAQSKQRAAAQTNPANLPSKPLPPAQAAREAKNEGGRGGGRGYGRGRGGAVGGYRRDFSNDENPFSNSGAPTGQVAPEDGEKASERRGYGAPRGPYRGGRGGGFNNGEAGEGERPRVFERRSGTGHGNEFKREGAGRGNWGTQSDEISQVNEEVASESEKNLGDEKPAGEEDAAEGNQENPTSESQEKEPEEKEMTLEEYQKVLEEKRKPLQALKTSEERKVDTKEFESMQQLSSKKGNDGVFIRLGSDKDKRREAAEKDEKAKRAVSINEFLKPAEGERYYDPGGRSRGRGRGRGSRVGYGGGSGMIIVSAPSIEDPWQFPTLGAK